MDTFGNKIELLDPINVLKRGYSITFLEGSPLTEAEKARKGQKIDTRLFNGTLRSTIDWWDVKQLSPSMWNVMKNYSNALKELEKIVEELERGDVAVDVLAAKVKRASELIRVCKAILKETGEEVENVLGDLEKV